MAGWKSLEQRIISCGRCPRLRSHCQSVARVKRKAYRSETYWGKPVPGFGDTKARLWIIGLAPGAHGANRTGRMFTGDKSGEWLYGALAYHGFSNHERSISLNDGLALTDVFISAAARCAPPDNKPLPLELEHCQEYLDAEFTLLKNRRLILALGAIAFQAILHMLERQQIEIPSPRPRFAHGRCFEFPSETILCSYHPSQQNTQTGRLTLPMWRQVFANAKEYLADR